MGTNFHAIIDHALSRAEIVSFDGVLQAEWQSLTSPLRMLERMPGREGWRWEFLPPSSTPEHEFSKRGSLDFVGPAKLYGEIFHHGMDIGSAIRWGTFLADHETQLSLCQAVRRIASMVRGHTIIYLSGDVVGNCPLDILHEAGNVDAVVACLARYSGPPAPHFEALAQAWATDGSGYDYLIEYLTTHGE